MGQTVGEMEQKFLQFVADADRHAMAIIEESKDPLVKLIQNQLMRGTDGKGVTLRPYRDEEYAAYKRTLNPLGVTDLRLSGSFHQQLRLWILSGQSFTIISDDTKYRKLAQQYGIDITTLSQESIDYYRGERFNPEYVRRIGDYTGAGIG